MIAVSAGRRPRRRSPFTSHARLPPDIGQLAVALVQWDEVALMIEAELPGFEGGCWYAPASTATMIRSYFLQRWSDQPVSAGVPAWICARFEYFFEHYQLKEAALRQIERQLRRYGFELREGRSAAPPTRSALAFRKDDQLCEGASRRGDVRVTD